MPWKESSVIEERLQFVLLASQPERNISELCTRFGVSRQTGHVWLKRYQEGGVKLLQEQSRRPKTSPQRTAAEIEAYVVGLRQQRPDWGAPKLSVLLRQHKPQWPVSERTVHRILERQGLILDEDRPVRATKRFERTAPNELWQMDFKGPQGFNRPGEAVGPLVIVDDHSRYVIEMKRLGSTARQGVQQTLERVWQQVGQPEAMLIDHGVPWWSPTSAWGLSGLSVWMMRHGIRLYYSGFRHPQTQGKVERTNGALQRAVGKRGRDPNDQEWLDSFRGEFNHIRPHESLEMATPASRWHPSTRPYTATPREWSYAASMEVMRVQEQGYVRWQGRRWEISSALRGERIGIEQVGERALVYFCGTPLRELDLKTGASMPIQANVRITTTEEEPKTGE